ncbi:hypothetical protein [Paenibacillus sp. PL91]|uniref:hypothetical protein n=1 Tax=Paenibacillus sp. PL91 TaxID=2729538 RepID=UPI00145DCF13|nr:hypothetical protein [Paenibacillus sp. PL91]MBC9203986.1 hypothetical protein [Paenibacillus sp. PL91]
MKKIGMLIIAKFVIIKIVGVKGSLLKTISTYLEAIKEKDDTKRLSTIYAPNVFSDGLNRQEPYIVAIKGLTLDNYRTLNYENSFLSVYWLC